MNKLSALLLGAFFISASGANGQDILNYQKPPQSVIDLVEAPAIPTVRINSDGTKMLLLEMPGLTSIEELSQPELRIGGLRINPARNGQSRTSGFTGMKLRSVISTQDSSFTGMPENPQLADITWSPDETMVAFSNSTASGIELWVADLKTLQAKRLSDLFLNDTYGRSFVWSPDGKSLLAKFVDDNREALAPEPTIPTGPIVQENMVKSAPAATYQDLLKNPYDELAFDHYLKAQLKLVDMEGKTSNFEEPGIIRSFEYSPDGQYILIAKIHRPYSYVVPARQFPFTISVYDKAAKLIKKLYDAPLAENIPAGFDGVPKGPREFGWRADKGAVLYWVEAQDNGNPAQQASVRDIIYTQSAPFAQKASKLAECYFRFNSILWGDDKLAIVTERWWKTRAERRVFIKPSNETFRVNLFDFYYEDAYSDPGVFVTKKNEFKRNVLLTEFNPLKRAADNVNLFTISDGASPEGDRPFILKFNIKTKLRDTLFRSEAPYYERPVFFNNGNFLISSREAADSVPNYYLTTLADKQNRQITQFEDPYPSLNGVQKQKISYKRLDGISLGGTLYLPKTYQLSEGPLPVLIWAYPREFKTAAAAGQVKGSPYQFIRLSSGSPIFWVTRGYAILDNADMPVIGESNKEPNDTFVEQIRYNAEAAIDHLVKVGVADPKRIAVGGHSYGAFMTVNLLAHTDLFAAGIARSGAYNRSLTPFGFQAEERTYWQASEVYNKMSPFSYADKIKAPLLLIHGEADNNSGTYPMQSERLYSALKGHGAITRLVILPSEAHSYRAKESVLHMMWEMDTWLEKYVKNK